MTTIDINESVIKRYLQLLRPTDSQIREQLDFGYPYDGKVVILYEIRPIWRNQKSQNIPFAKIRYYKSRKEWNLYWMRASGKWETYKPFSKSSNLQKVLDVIQEDKNHCFFG